MLAEKPPRPFRTEVSAYELVWAGRFGIFASVVAMLQVILKLPFDPG